MSISRRNFIAAAGAGIAAPAILRLPANAAEVTLKLHQFLPPVSNVVSKLLVPWAKKIEADSNNRIKIDIYPSMQLGGAPPQLYDQVRDGIADITLTLPGYTTGRFPSTEVFELPFIANRSSVINAKAAQEFAETYLVEETKEVKLLGFWAHDHGLVHSVKPVEKLEDMKGLKLRSASRMVGEALKALGASPVGMPVTQIPESLAQKVIDGVTIPWEVVPAVKVHELVRYHTELAGSPAFFSATFFQTMNLAKYNSLPADLKKVIDDNSGQAFAVRAGEMWDSAGKAVSEMVKARGNTIITLSEEEKARWIKACEPVTEAWIKEMKSKGKDGGKLVEVARTLLAKYAKA